MKHLENRNAAVIGSGPNGMAAAVTLARAGLEVTVYEKNNTPGGACRSTELIKPGYVHDIGSAVHPLAVHSPFLRSLPLEQYGLKWIVPEYSLAHPLDNGSAAALSVSIEETVSTLDSVDRDTYRKLMLPLAGQGQELIDEITRFPKLTIHHPLLILRFGLKALCSTRNMTKRYFDGTNAQALFTGLGIHSVMDQEKPGSIAAGLLLATAAHLSGWVIPEGGAQKITYALTEYLKELGGRVTTGYDVKSLDELNENGLILMDTTPHQLLKIAGNRIPSSYRRRLQKYRYGPGIFKIDWILSEPVPWTAAECHSAGTVHIGGTFEEIIAAEKDVFNGNHPEKPFVLLSQPSLFDTTRTPDSSHILWGYCHVPAGSTVDMTERIENQIERFAPGFKETILERRSMTTADIESDNPNCIRGDITGGSQSLKKLFFPDFTYETSIDNVFICSSSVPPGPGVHGMCGFRSAMSALRKFGITGD